MENQQMNQTQAPQGKKRMNPGIIAAIVAGGLVVALLLSWGIWSWIRSSGGVEDTLGQTILGGKISEAEEKAQDANVRAIRAAAAVDILTNDTPQGAWGWEATATIDDDGNMGRVSVVPADSAVEDVVPEDGVAGEYVVGITPANIG